jgi:hypothetical protein
MCTYSTMSFLEGELDKIQLCPYIIQYTYSRVCWEWGRVRRDTTAPRQGPRIFVLYIYGFFACYYLYIVTSPFILISGAIANRRQLLKPRVCVTTQVVISQVQGFRPHDVLTSWFFYLPVVSRWAGTKNTAQSQYFLIGYVEKNSFLEFSRNQVWNRAGQVLSFQSRNWLLLEFANRKD